GSIRRRSKNSWELTVDLGRDSFGRRKRRYVNIKGTKSQAQRKLREVVSALDKGDLSDQRDVSGDDLVFGDVYGSPLSPNTVSHAFRDICKKSAIDGIRFHDLRHTHATLLMKQGVNPKVVQERLGHSTISVTLDIYSHVVPGMQELAVLQFDEIIKLPVDSY
ncbi:MAG: site-specific integrase, partial [Chloroflexota bacterium]|nr:site-specific integrase [Chloroflexota bacterium]